MTQYVKLSSEEQVYGTKNLLEAQASMLTGLQHLENYQKLRAEELKMRILLKKILGEAREGLISLNKALPAVPKEKKKEENEAIIEMPKIEPVKPMKPKIIKIVRLTKDEKEKVSPIEQELEEIKKKLARLG